MSWAETQHILASPTSLGIPITSLAFDPFSDLLFSGTSTGNLLAHYGPSLNRYTSALAHGTKTKDSRIHPQETVRGIVLDERCVYSVGDGSVRAQNRRGLCRWNELIGANNQSLKLSSICFSPVLSSSDLIVCGSHAVPQPDPSSADSILVLNSSVGGVVRRGTSDAPLSHVRRTNRLLACGTSNGQVQLRDPRSLNVEHRLHAHPGGLIEVQAEGNYVWSAGWTVRLGHPVPEPYVKVHDVRSLRALSPLPFSAPGGPALLAIHPKLSSTVMAASPGGQLQVVDVNNAGSAQYYQVATNSYLSSMAVSASSDYMAFGEGDGSIRLWANVPPGTDPTSAGLRFAPHIASPPEMADVPEMLQPIQWSIETPLSSIGMPHYTETLLSVLDYNHYSSSASPLFNPPTKIDPQVLSTMRTVDGVAYAPLPRHLRGKRNQISGQGPGGTAKGDALKAAGLAGGSRSDPAERRRIGMPLFRSEREKEQARAKTNAADSQTPDTPLSPGAEFATSKEETRGMPSYYGVKTIQYSKFGIEDFDFDFYNKTPFSGLETHIQNSYSNAYLQSLHYLLPFRKLAEQHCLNSAHETQATCSVETCLLCEAGFLFRSLDTAKGQNCQATNFFRALGNNERAISLGLMDKEDSPHADTAYSNLIQTFNRFVLDAVSQEAARHAERPSPGQQSRRANPVSALFRSAVRTRNVCSTCGFSSDREANSSVVDLVYPRKAMSNELPPPSDFASILKVSLLRETMSKALCRHCHTSNSIIRSLRELPAHEDLPKALSINVNVHTAEQLAYWIDGIGPSGIMQSTSSTSSSGINRQTFLPPYVAVDVRTKDVRIWGIWDEHAMLEAKEEGGVALYTTRSIVVQIQAEKEAPHLCCIVRIPKEQRSSSGSADGAERRADSAKAEPTESDANAQSLEGSAQKGKSITHDWYLFNDFLVRGISQAEALGFPAIWKIPAIVWLERVDVPTLEASLALPRSLDTTSLLQDTNIAWRRDPNRVRHEILRVEELPKPGTLVAIDAEFVALSMEELEVRSDGTRSVIRPSRLTLARVSVLRGEGPKEGTPFIDEHIHTREPVVDYLTQFSGILHGDLTPESSKHTLVPLKMAYKKLRLLVELGCVFIGHGLKKDFRIINIHVPEHQVIDTVDLYHSAAHPRKLSLRFLSWFLLKQDIQGSSAKNSEQGLEAGSGAVEGHDSIEDALAALRLYRLYENFKRDGRLDDVMEDLYEEGRRVNWKPPVQPSNSNTSTHSLPTQIPTGSEMLVPITAPSQAWPDLG
ncbi:hypothetical protein IE81DRAFT_292061 [Ceraceosorus guamensis]|uniref:PAN2-PAN3 deadenylation complex catalytic subunit PAN2 n=1 Tax=Ceraceosorus guamensis TaxID=1522189 RepID=A0A316VY45_9BASI|nr:hypothetical protein IE81DRAFT_292061 [Ceraceosorus guamensis]PWN41313.1 hypothetical protein IE81DRAFT_292061 [Ceraceosorus guamensis]